MGSPLGPLLANVFVGSLEERLFNQPNAPLLYKRYVDDVFAIFYRKDQCYDFLQRLNMLHTSIQFTCEEEINNKIAFLDVQIEKDLDSRSFVTSVFRKGTFTGQYVKWESFCSKRRKVNLISTLTHRAVLLCSPNKLDAELNNIKKILGDNGYPSSLVNSIIDSKLKSVVKQRIGPRKCPVTLHLPYIGNPSYRFEKQVSRAVSACFGAVALRTIFHSKSLLPTNRKDPLPTMMKSKIVYQYTCRCDQRYVGRTGQRLKTRIEQHIPRYLRQAAIISDDKLTPSSEAVKSDSSNTTASGRLPRRAKQTSVQLQQKDDDVASSIAKHLIENPLCAQVYHPNQFKIVTFARTDFHLKVLESVYIQSLKPALCRQKTFVYECLLF